jgi:hypothetical protein
MARKLVPIIGLILLMCLQVSAINGCDPTTNNCTDVCGYIWNTPLGSWSLHYDKCYSEYNPMQSHYWRIDLLIAEDTWQGISCPSALALSRSVSISDCTCIGACPDVFNFSNSYFIAMPTTTTTTINEAAYLPPIHLKAGKIMQPQQQPTPIIPQKGLLEQLMNWLNSLFT